MHFVPSFETGNEADFLLNEANRLRIKYPKIIVAPMLYKVDVRKIFLINED